MLKKKILHEFTPNHYKDAARHGHVDVVGETRNLVSYKPTLPSAYRQTTFKSVYFVQH
jgi:hypothetical protein